MFRADPVGKTTTEDPDNHDLGVEVDTDAEQYHCQGVGHQVLVGHIDDTRGDILTRTLEAVRDLPHREEKQPAQGTTGKPNQETRRATDTGVSHLLKVSGDTVVNRLHDESLDLNQGARKYTNIDRLLRQVAGADPKAPWHVDTIILNTHTQGQKQVIGRNRKRRRHILKRLLGPNQGLHHQNLERGLL